MLLNELGIAKCEICVACPASVRIEVDVSRTHERWRNVVNTSNSNARVFRMGTSRARWLAELGGISEL